jgi:hypothetical protein
VFRTSEILYTNKQKFQESRKLSKGERERGREKETVKKREKGKEREREKGPD